MKDLNSYKPEFEKIIEHLKTELGGLRTNRATPALVENIQVEAYGTRQPLKTLSSISTSDAKTLLIEPWDKSIIKEIEKAILTANTGLNPVNEGNHLRIVLPPLTEDSRKELVKLLSAKLEEARIAVRTLREKIRSSIIQAEREKEISEDERYKLQDKLDEIVEEYNKAISQIGETKENEIKRI
jgi:ribosome recycling factor